MIAALSFRGKARMFLRWTRVLVSIYGKDAYVVDVIKNRRGKL